MDVDVLISLVQNYPELYNVKHPDYFNNTRRDNCWEEIGGIMKEAGADCKDRWGRLRDNHRKALQRRRTKSGQAAKKIKPAKYEQELSFLTPYLSNGDILQSNFAPSDNHQNLPSDCDEEQEFNGEPDEVSVLSPTVSLQIASDCGSPLVTAADKNAFTPVSPTNLSSHSASSSVNNHRVASGLKPRKRSRYPPVKSVASVLENFLRVKKSEKCKEGNSEDAITTFFISMAKTVSSFPIRDQIQVKKKLYQIISDKEMDIALKSESEKH